jgi:hypothetical protein
MTLEEARKIIAAAEKKAVEIKQPMNIAVVDEGAILFLMFAWMAPGSAASTSRSIKHLPPAPSILRPKISPSIRNRAGSFSAFMSLITVES